MDELVEWIDKQVADRRDWLKNNEAVVAAFSSQMEAFEARTGHNVYAVRMAVDHRNNAKRDLEDLRMFETLKKMAENNADLKEGE